MDLFTPNPKTLQALRQDRATRAGSQLAVTPAKGLRAACQSAVETSSARYRLVSPVHISSVRVDRALHHWRRRGIRSGRRRRSRRAGVGDAACTERDGCSVIPISQFLGATCRKYSSCHGQ
jgi:hypothetical protein